MQGRRDDHAQEGAPPGGGALPEKAGDGHEDEELEPALAEPVLPDGPVHVLGPLEELPVVVCPAPLAGGPEKPSLQSIRRRESRSVGEHGRRALPHHMLLGACGLAAPGAHVAE